MSAQPVFHLIGGPNGAGKTTFAKEYLPNEANCLRFHNSDEIATGISPLNPAAAQTQAARILLNGLKESIARKETFALESTLSGKTYVRYLNLAKSSGFAIHLHYLDLPSADESLCWPRKGDHFRDRRDHRISHLHNLTRDQAQQVAGLQDPYCGRHLETPSIPEQPDPQETLRGAQGIHRGAPSHTLEPRTDRIQFPIRLRLYDHSQNPLPLCPQLRRLSQRPSQASPDPGQDEKKQLALQPPSKSNGSA